MDTSNGISILALAAVHLGFASLLGRLIQPIRAGQKDGKNISVLLFAGTLFIAASLSLPLSVTAKGVIWLLSALLIALSGWRFEPTSRNSSWVWLYAGLTMSLIVMWGLGQVQPLKSISFSLSAGIAAFLSWRRGLAAAQRKTV